jgi:hypothetical protein
MKQLAIMGMLAVMFGGSLTILAAHAINRQQIVMQEGY